MAMQQDTVTAISSFNPNSSDDHRTFIDHEVSSLRARIVEIFRKRNSLAPISQLSAAILSTIFLLCTESRETVTWVCHTWRSTALKFPPLWTQLDLRPGTNEDRLEELLSRSKLHPLAVRYHRFSDRNLNETSGLLVPLRAGRLQCLVLDGILSMRSINDILIAAAQNTEHLQVIDIAHEISWGPIDLPAAFLSAIAPAMTTLKLRYIKLFPLVNSPFLSSVSGTLTALHLGAGTHTQKHILLEILQKLANLEVLTMKYIQYSGRTEDLTSSESLPRYITDLRNLRKLNIVEGQLGNYDFLPFLYYPLSCYVKAEFLLLQDHDSIIQLPFLFMNHIRIWDKDARDAPSWHMRFNFVGKSVLLDLNIPGANGLAVSFGRYDTPIQYISELYRLLPCDHLRSVTYCGWESLVSDIACCWLDNLPHFALLEELHLESSVGQCSNRGVVHEDHQQRKRPIGSPFFSEIQPDSLPKLRLLSLTSVIVSESAITDLCGWLEKRAALGVCVPQVTMLDCEISQGVLDTLRQNLEKVSLDEACEITEASV